MELKLNNIGNVKVIEIYGKFDIENTEEFETLYNKQLESKPGTLAIDMNKLDKIIDNTKHTFSIMLYRIFPIFIF